MSSAIVLLSSGLDSTVNLACAVREYDVKKVITFNYGQKAARKEIEHSAQICAHYKLQHQIINLDWLKNITNSALVSDNAQVPVREEVAIDDIVTSQRTAEKVWVPNRNGVFLNIAAAIAESLGAEYVIPGFNAEEAQTFPDNSADYLRALDKSFSFSTASKVKTLCFTHQLHKIDIVKLGREVSAPFDLMWSCYFGGDKMCGECESCQRFFRAAKE